MTAHRADQYMMSRQSTLEAIASWRVFKEQADMGPGTPTAAPDADEDWGFQDGLSDPQEDLATNYCDIVNENGPFDKGPDGCQYTDSSPLASAGIRCGTCIFYEQGACDIVDGEIDPGGLCRFNIVPSGDATPPSQAAVPGHRRLRMKRMGGY